MPTGNVATDAMCDMLEMTQKDNVMDGNDMQYLPALVSGYNLIKNREKAYGICLALDLIANRRSLTYKLRMETL